MMNKKTTLILSIIGIITVIIALIGFTYAYYATRVNGNTTEKSVDIVTVNKSIEYIDLSETETSEIIGPGYENIKIFTVHNTGTGKAMFHIYLSEVVNEYTRIDDIKYILYKKAGNNTITDTDNFTDCEKISEGVFPKNNTYIKTDETIEIPNEYYTYALKTIYTNSMYNQDIDQGKSFSSKVQIHSEIENNFTEGTLAYEIINNSLHPTQDEQTAGHAKFTVPTPTVVAVEKNNETESVISVANDDEGLSYYYRGNVKNNYVNYNNMCWRIIRIEGDGSIKMLLEDKSQECNSSITGDWAIASGNYGYDETTIDSTSIYTANYLKATKESSAKSNFDSFEKTLNLGFLKEDTWCLGNLTDAYNGSGEIVNEGISINDYRKNNLKFLYHNRVKAYGHGNTEYASLMCNDKNDVKFNSYVGTLNVDEVLYTGINASDSNSNNFLNNFYSINITAWWTLSISTYYNEATPPRDGAFHVSGNGYITTNYVDYTQDHRPAITLKTGTLIGNGSGNGSIDSPYKIG